MLRHEVVTFRSVSGRSEWNVKCHWHRTNATVKCIAIGIERTVTHVSPPSLSATADPAVVDPPRPCATPTHPALCGLEQVDRGGAAAQRKTGWLVLLPPRWFKTFIYGKTAFYVLPGLFDLFLFGPLPDVTWTYPVPRLWRRCGKNPKAVGWFQRQSQIVTAFASRYSLSSDVDDDKCQEIERIAITIERLRLRAAEAHVLCHAARKLLFEWSVILFQSKKYISCGKHWKSQ